jgi:hypothetical protein
VQNGVAARQKPKKPQNLIAIYNEMTRDLLLNVAFIARAARFFHYAIAIALSTSEDMLKSFCASARPTQSYLLWRD